MRIASTKFWQGKRVLLTGHTGFKGAWLAFWLSKMGANVTGISLHPKADPNLFTLADISQITNSYFTDIRNLNALTDIVEKVRPEIVLHLAAQALVRSGYKDSPGTFATNVMGTVNVLNSLRGLDSVRAVVAVTTDKVYQNLEHNEPYCETDVLGGYDPYSASKAASEIIISSYRDSYLAEQNVAVASARAGNVIGGGDWSEDRLIPDAVRAWDANVPLKIRRPDAVRPWQHVLEPINGYLVLAEKIYADLSLAGAYNFGPKVVDAATVRTVIDLANHAYGCGSVLWGSGFEGPHEAGLLFLETSKAQDLLGVTPIWNLQESVKRTMAWYQALKSGASARSLCSSDIAAFCSARRVDKQ